MYRSRTAVPLAFFVAVIVVAGLNPAAGQKALANGIIIAPIHDGPTATTIVPDRRRPHHRPILSWMPFEVASQSVDVKLTEATAETTVEQVFINRSGSQQEGQYFFPIAEDAGVRRFTMWMDGKEVVGELLDADRARAIYESIVAKARDPGLLQFAGRGLIQAKVFPIPAGGECRIRLQYTEPVKIDGGLAAYRFPLGAPSAGFKPVAQFSLRVAITTDRPLISAFSPTHACSVDRRSEKEVVLGFEKQRLEPESDFQLFAQLGNDAFGLSLLPYRLGEDEGFFMARISPRLASRDDAVLPKNIMFVLDTSGSMADGNKIAQARKALQFCVTNLNRQDRFNIMSFATEIRAFRDSWSLADDTSKNAARAFIDELNAVGGTDINGALARALEMRPSAAAASEEAWRNNPYFVVFITDGEPTVGVTNPDEIIKNVAAANKGGSTRIFSLGVGYQVNTKLLDRLSDDNGGARDYVTPSEDLELKMSAFYTKLANPVLADVALQFEGVSVHDLYPRKMPDLFEGGELVVVGRYGGAKENAQITLSGTVRGEKRSYNYACVFPAQAAQNDYLPRFWAMRKIGFLLDELRLHGENMELRTEVIRLSKLYGILTPYTSYLVQEDERMAVRERRAPAGGGFMPAPVRAAMDDKDDEYADAAAGQSAKTGRSATVQSRGNRKLRDAPAEGAQLEFKRYREDNRDAQGRELVNFVGPKTFYFDGERWVDAGYDGKAPTQKLVLFSKEYYDTLKQHRDLAGCFAQGERVIVSIGGKHFETVVPTDEKAGESGGSSKGRG